MAIDFLGRLPQLNNFDYLLVIIDRLTSQVHLVPTMTTVTAKGIVWIILKEVIRLHGISESIVSDRNTIHFHILEGTAKTHGNKTSHVNSVSSANGWHHRKR